MKTTKQEMITCITRQLATEFGCQWTDFQKVESTLVTPVLNEGRRHFNNEKIAPFFKMATFGAGAVISASEELHPFFKKTQLAKLGHRIFEFPNLLKINRVMEEYGRRLSSSFHMFLPHPETNIPEEICEIKWFEQEQLQGFYAQGHFPNALCTQFEPLRPDVLAVVAYDNGEISGMAGCSADTPELWQIGIDIFPGYRGRGLGTYLVSLLKREVLQRNKIPYYGTSLSNLHSWNIALNSGFFPAWVEITAEDS